VTITRTGKGIGALRRPADGDNQALERPIFVCLAQPTSLATHHRAIKLLAHGRYEAPRPA